MLVTLAQIDSLLLIANEDEEVLDNDTPGLDNMNADVAKLE